MAEMMRRVTIDKSFVHLDGWVPADMMGTVQNRLQEAVVSCSSFS